MTLKTCLAEKARQRNSYIGYYLNNVSLGQRGGGRGGGQEFILTEKGYKGTLWNDRNILYFDACDGLIGMYICRESLSCTFRGCAF